MITRVKHTKKIPPVVERPTEPVWHGISGGRGLGLVWGVVSFLVLSCYQKVKFLTIKLSDIQVKDVNYSDSSVRFYRLKIRH